MLKRILIPLTVAAGLLGPLAAHANTAESIVSELRDQGFTRIEIKRTLLGRTRIIAESPAYEREIILNPASGVILRDFWTTRGGGGGGGSGPSSIVGAPGDRDVRSASDNSGPGSANSGRDDSDNDDDDDDGDNSGSGSGGSDDSDDDDDSDNSGSGSGSDDNDNDDDD